MSAKNTAKKEQAPCPYAKKCGGCQLMNMTYPEQLSWKTARCIKLLGRFCHIEDIIGMQNPTHYRNKVQAAFQLTRSGKIVSGVYQSGTHNVVNVNSCLTEDIKADEITVYIRSLLPRFKILPYNEDSRAGFLRHVLVRRGFSSGEIMVVLVGANPRFPMKSRLCDALVERFPEITTVVFNINPHKTSMVLGERSETLYGKGYIEDTLCGCTFRISPASFYQINPVQTEVLYNTAIEFASLNKDSTVIDAYCGTGTIGIAAAKYAGSVTGVELNPEAVKDAVFNAKRNHIENIAFVKADAGEFMLEAAEQGETADIVFMDPPRAGSDKKFLSSLVTLAPEKVVYISCNPETLARDLTFLTKNGYKVRKIQPVDMFPFTNHVETVVLLSQQKPKFTVDIDINLDEFDQTAAEAKATYQEIQHYIYKKYKLKVSHLNIAQIKRKYGIIERQNYNLPKSEDSRQPQCTPEKEQAIVDALKYFKMI